MSSPSNFPFHPAFTYSDRRSAQARSVDRHAIRNQVGKLGPQQNTEALRQNLIRELAARHAVRRRTPLAPVADRLTVNFERLPGPPGAETLAVPGELLVRGSALTNQNRDLLARRGLQATRVVGAGHPQGRLLRVVTPGIAGSDLVALAGELRAGGLAVSPHYVTPTGVVWKGLASPQPSAGPGPSRPAPAGGSRVQVALVDTGITAEVRSDEWLADVGRIPNDNIDPLDTLPLPGGDGYLDLAAGHGTFVAGVIQQVAPDADLRVYRGFTGDGIASEITVADAMVRAVEDGAQILNLSFAVETLDEQPPLALAVAIEMINEMAANQQREVLIVAAAGNFGRPRKCWPAAFPGVTAVAALTQDLQPAEWSSHGDWVTCATIGEGVLSTYVEGTQSTVIGPDPDTFEAGSWALWSGTSFAAPQVVGAAALIAQQTGQAPRAALDQLLAGHADVADGWGPGLEILPRT
jgi:subtilisin family serine protease